MPEDLSWMPLGDMVESVLKEVYDRTTLSADDSRIVMAALAVAANNGRMTGMAETIAQLEQQGISVPISVDEDGGAAPRTVAGALGEE